MDAKQNKIRIIIADDHPLLRHALRDILEKEPDFEVVAEAGTGEEAILLTGKLKPDIVIMDISMPEPSGLEATRQIKTSYPDVFVLVLTVHSDSEHILSILQAGASGYLTKAVYNNEVINAIRAVVSGEMVLSPLISKQILKYAYDHITKPVKLEMSDKLTPREVDILRLVARGMSNKDIAERLGLTLRTIKGYLVEIFSKMNVGSRTEAVITGLRKGILTQNDIE